MGLLDYLFGEDDDHGPRSAEEPDIDRMSLADLWKVLAERTGVSEELARRVVANLFDPETGIISRAVNRGVAVQVTGFGTFHRREKSAGTVFNPRTGEKRRIGPRHYPAIRFSETLRKAIRDPES